MHRISSIIANVPKADFRQEQVLADSVEKRVSGNALTGCVRASNAIKCSTTPGARAPMRHAGIGFPSSCPCGVNHIAILRRFCAMAAIRNCTSRIGAALVVCGRRYRASATRAVRRVWTDIAIARGDHSSHFRCPRLESARTRRQASTCSPGICLGNTPLPAGRQNPRAAASIGRACSPATWARGGYALDSLHRTGSPLCPRGPIQLFGTSIVTSVVVSPARCAAGAAYVAIPMDVCPMGTITSVRDAIPGRMPDRRRQPTVRARFTTWAFRPRTTSSLTPAFGRSGAIRSRQDPPDSRALSGSRFNAWSRFALAASEVLHVRYTRTDTCQGADPGCCLPSSPERSISSRLGPRRHVATLAGASPAFTGPMFRSGSVTSTCLLSIAGHYPSRLDELHTAPWLGAVTRLRSRPSMLLPGATRFTTW